MNINLNFFFDLRGFESVSSLGVFQTERVYFAQVHANSSYVQKHKAVNGPGFVVETGLQMFCTQHLFLDVFAAYSWVHLDSSSHRPNVIAASLHLSGINAGGGIGVKF